MIFCSSRHFVQVCLESKISVKYFPVYPGQEEKGYGLRRHYHPLYRGAGHVHLWDADYGAGT